MISAIRLPVNALLANVELTILVRFSVLKSLVQSCGTAENKHEKCRLNWTVHVSNISFLVHSYFIRSMSDRVKILSLISK